MFNTGFQFQQCCIRYFIRFSKQQWPAICVYRMTVATYVCFTIHAFYGRMPNYIHFSRTLTWPNIITAKFRLYNSMLSVVHVCFSFHMSTLECTTSGDILTCRLHVVLVKHYQHIITFPG